MKKIKNKLNIESITLDKFDLGAIVGGQTRGMDIKGLKENYDAAEDLYNEGWKFGRAFKRGWDKTEETLTPKFDAKIGRIDKRRINRLFTDPEDFDLFFRDVGFWDV